MADKLEAQDHSRSIRMAPSDNIIKFKKPKPKPKPASPHREERMRKISLSIAMLAVAAFLAAKMLGF
jgi:hypothetical protein